MIMFRWLKWHILQTHSSFVYLNMFFIVLFPLYHSLCVSVALTLALCTLSCCCLCNGTDGFHLVCLVQKCLDHSRYYVAKHFSHRRITDSLK